MSRSIKSLVPPRLRRFYHRLLSWAAMMWYGRPSRHLAVIGVTGTDGKTTTATLIADLLTAGGHTVGLSSTVYVQVGAERQLNERHMTMPGRFAMQRLLRRMVNAKCDVAVIEVSSEGILQYRHAGIDFDIAIITNLSPEHLGAHGNFESYRAAKGRLFGKIIKGGDKHIQGRVIKKATVVNLDDPSADFFLKFWAEEHHGITLNSARAVTKDKLTIWSANDIRLNQHGSSFTINSQPVQLSLTGRYNIYNALEAIVIARYFEVPWETITTFLAHIPAVPGRGEELATGRDWRVIIDYAVTPNAFQQFLSSLDVPTTKGIIAVFGAAGGGRDRWKRPELGRIASEHCRVIILTTEDPYDDDPAEIAGQIASGIPQSATAQVLTILDRRAAIAKAFQLAQPGEVVTITGMGAETSMMLKGKTVPWSDAAVVRELLSRA